jgi:oligoendopeptidase F
VTQFQNWLYKNPGHSIEARERQWALLDEQYGPPIDWSLHEHIRSMQWQQQPHVFIYPFYYPVRDRDLWSYRSVQSIRES